MCVESVVYLTASIFFHRYYFKTHSEDVGVVWEELLDDSELLPLYQDKVVGKIDKIE